MKENIASRFVDHGSLFGSKLLHAVPLDKKSSIDDLSFCGAIADRLLLSTISGKFPTT